MHDVVAVFEYDETTRHDPNVRSRPRRCTLGRLVATGRYSELIEEFRVRDRAYRGSTTMDAELSFARHPASRVVRGELSRVCGHSASLSRVSSRGEETMTTLRSDHGARGRR